MSITLHEKKILVTREASQAKEFSEKVLQHGGKPVEVPLLKISCKDVPGNKPLLHSADKYKWIFFTSANGVNCFFQHEVDHNVKNLLDDCKFAAVGHKTAQILEQYGYQADFIPFTYNAETMASEFLSLYKIIEDPILLVRGNRSKSVLPDCFTEKGIQFSMLEVYETNYNYQVKAQLNQLLDQNEIDFITFTSPSTVEAFFNMKNSQILNNPVVVCIGTSTEECAMKYGITDIITPKDFTIDGMLEQISDFIDRKGQI